MQKATKSAQCDATARIRDERQPRHERDRIINDSTNGELRLCGARRMMMNPIAMCDKLDKMFGSGAEAIVHYMLFESGRDTFDAIVGNNQGRSRGDLLKTLVDLQPCTGWGFVSLTILQADPPTVEVSVRNPPVKVLKGSQKQIIGSYWAGVLSAYFSRQLASKNLGYDADKDEFNCVVTV